MAWEKIYVYIETEKFLRPEVMRHINAERIQVVVVLCLIVVASTVS